MAVATSSRVRTPPISHTPDAAGWSRPNLALLVTALVYGLSQIQVWRADLGWDETVYFSQVSRTVPAAYFSAPRARGISWLAEPLALMTSSTSALRIYLTVLTALALYLAFRVWFGVLAPGAVVVSAALFGSLWIARFYGPELMANLWVAFGVLAGVGGFLRLAADRRDRLGMVALPLGLAVAALMRPSDAAWATAPLLVMALLVPRWRRNWLLLLLTAAGPAVAVLPWVVEADQRFGGISGRLRRASQIEGGLGWHPSVLLQHWQTLDGPLLCRPCTPAAHPPVDTFWLLLIPVAMAAALFVRRRAGETGNVVVAMVVAVALAVPYLLLVGYSAPRFLLPAFALAALPVGLIGWWLIRTGLDHGWSGRLLTGAVILAIGVQFVAQQRIFQREVTEQVRLSGEYAAIGTDLNQLGLTGRCVVSGTWGPPAGYYSGCSSREVGGHDGSITPAGLLALSRQQPVAVIRPGSAKAPAYARHWTRHQLPGSPALGSWVAYVSSP